MLCPQCGKDIESLTEHECADDNEDRLRQGEMSLDTVESVQRGESISPRRSW